VVELGGGLVGKGARHLGTFNKSAWKEITWKLATLGLTALGLASLATQLNTIGFQIYVY
jgi:hypothetical protein